MTLKELLDVPHDLDPDFEMLISFYFFLRTIDIFLRVLEDYVEDDLDCSAVDQT